MELSSAVQDDGILGLSGCSADGDTFRMWDVLCRENS